MMALCGQHTEKMGAPSKYKMELVIAQFKTKVSES